MDRKELVQIISNQFQINSLLEMIYEKAKNRDLTVLVEQFKDYKGIDLGKRPLYNQHTMISSLYTFIALPKEVIWENIPEKMTVNELDDKWGLNIGWKIKDGKFSDLKFRYLIRRLRNGINHGKVECNEQLIFTIIDISRNGKDRIDFEIEYNSLDKFCKALGYWIITDDIELISF